MIFRTRIIFLIIASVLLPCSLALANYTLAFELGAMKTATGTAVPVGSVGVLVADTGNNNFVVDGDGSGLTIAGSTLAVGQSLGASDNIIVGIFTAADLGSELQSGETGFLATVQFDSSLGTFQSGVTKLALYWFPSITTTGSLLSVGVSYGYYRSDAYDTNWANVAFFAPPESFMYRLVGFDTNNGGTIDPNSLKALNVTAIPEPSSVVLLAAGGFLVMGTMLRRRKVA